MQVYAYVDGEGALVVSVDTETAELHLGGAEDVPLRVRVDGAPQLVHRHADCEHPPGSFGESEDPPVMAGAGGTSTSERHLV